MLRNKYMELNDYNRNLVELISNNPAIEIVEQEYDVIGINPLNSTNVIIWKFKK